MHPLANNSPTRNNKWVSLLLSNNGRKWSLVIPDGPPAAPFLADLTFLLKIFSSRLNWHVGRRVWDRVDGPGRSLPQLCESVRTTLKTTRPSEQPATLGELDVLSDSGRPDGDGDASLWQLPQHNFHPRSCFFFERERRVTESPVKFLHRSTVTHSTNPTREPRRRPSCFGCRQIPEEDTGFCGPTASHLDTEHHQPGAPALPCQLRERPFFSSPGLQQGLPIGGCRAPQSDPDEVTPWWCRLPAGTRPTKEARRP